MSDYSSDGANDDVFSMRDHVDDVLEFKEEPSDCCPDLVDLEQRKHAYVEDLATHKVMNKVTLASVALLTESEAARVFNMGTTRFKARCRSLGIQRWPHRKLMSLKNLYYDLTLHLNRALDNGNEELVERVKFMMSEIKSYATLLEGDLSLLNRFYNGKKAWPENILKIRQTIYKKRHAQVLVDKKNAASNDKKRKAPPVSLQVLMKKQKFEEEVKYEDDSATEEDTDGDLHLPVHHHHLDIADDDIIKIDDDERIWWFLALGEENANQQAA